MRLDLQYSDLVLKYRGLKQNRLYGRKTNYWGCAHRTARGRRAPYADLILAVRSAYFIGNPASSFSANVVMIRRALGAAPESTNLRVQDFPRPASYNEQFA